MMTSRRSHHKPPQIPFSNISNVSGSQSENRRSVGPERMTPRATGTAKGKQPLAAVTNCRQDSPASDKSGTEASECETLEFSKEEVESLLTEKFKGKPWEYKAKTDFTEDHRRRLKLCLRWFQEVERKNVQEKEKLQVALDSSEEKRREAELALREKEEELTALITDLKSQNAALQESLQTEISEKLNALELYRTEKEVRVAGERLQDSLQENLARSEQEISDAHQKVNLISDSYKRMQEYNTSLQQFNASLQADLKLAKESLKRAQDEKAAMVQNMSMLRNSCSVLQDRLSSSGVR